jgi:hypothetical protein
MSIVTANLLACLGRNAPVVTALNIFPASQVRRHKNNFHIHLPIF